MKTKLTALLCAGVLMSACVPAGALPLTAFAEAAEPVPTSGTCGENLTWTLDDAGTLTISGKGDMKNYYKDDPSPWSRFPSNSIKKVVIKLGKTDLRRGIDGLASIIRLSGNMDPMERGTLYLFCGSRPDRIKGLTFEGDGYLLLTKRLSRDSRFQWPRSAQ